MRLDRNITHHYCITFEFKPKLTERLRTSRQLRIHLGACKSSAGYRDIPIPRFVAREFGTWLSQRSASKTDLVFPTRTGSVLPRNNILRHGWWKAQVRIGLTKPDGSPKYHFHSLRHFFASLMI